MEALERTRKSALPGEQSLGRAVELSGTVKSDERRNGQHEDRKVAPQVGDQRGKSQRQDGHEHQCHLGGWTCCVPMSEVSRKHEL